MHRISLANVRKNSDSFEMVGFYIILDISFFFMEIDFSIRNKLSNYNHNRMTSALI